jgi:DNA-binding Lrp family transcriptional regulator
LVNLRIDSKDLQILKILGDNCRTSYHSIGHILNISATTAKKRVNNLISNKVIEQLTTVVNFSFLGYGKVLTVLLRHDSNIKDNNDDIDEKIANYMRGWGNVYMHIYAIGGISAFCLAIKHNSDDQLSSHNHNLVDSLRENLVDSLGSNISILDIFLGYHLSEISKKFKLLKIDLKIIKCLLKDPRMKYLDIARKVSASQRTVIRRIEKLQRNHVIVNFSIIHNPSKMKGYNYFSVILKTDTNQSRNVMMQITYSELKDYILKLPSFSFEDRIIINFHMENAFDIESIIKKIQSVKGVRKVEVFHPIRIKWIQNWLNKELDAKIHSIYR